MAESNGSLPPGLWLASPAGWLPRTGISSGTLRSSTGFLYLLPSSRLVEIVFSTCFSVCAYMLVRATLRLFCRRRLVFLMIQNAHQNQNAQQIRLTWPQKTTDRKLAENSYIQKADFKTNLWTMCFIGLLVYWFSLSTFKRHLKFRLFQSAFTVQSSCASASDSFSRFLALYKFVCMYWSCHMIPAVSFWLISWLWLYIFSFCCYHFGFEIELFCENICQWLKVIKVRRQCRKHSSGELQRLFA